MDKWLFCFPAFTTSLSTFALCSYASVGVIIVNQIFKPTPPLLSPSLCRQYETFSYLPPLTTEQIAKQVNYVITNGWTPCLEFADPATSFVSNENTVRFGNVSAVSDCYLSHIFAALALPLCPSDQPLLSSDQITWNN